MTEPDDHHPAPVELYDGDGQALMRFESLPALQASTAMEPSSAFLSALHTVGVAAPALQTALRQAASTGQALTVTFPPHVLTGLANNSLHLMKAADGFLPTAVDSAGRIVANGRVVTGVGVTGLAVTGVTAGALAAIALPIVIASAAAYAQQRQLEQSLASIKAVVERIEERLEDSDSGVCDSADRFLAVVQDCMHDGGLTDYLRLELAAQRTAVEALYSARKRWVDRFKANLEQQQIERERSKGAGQPWVDAVVEQAKTGKLEQELILFVRSLLTRTKLSILAALAIAEEGRGTAAMQLIRRAESELRSEFFDLHRRLVPLARLAPEPSLLRKLPGMGAGLQQAQTTVRVLVEHLNDHVLPVIPDPDNQREVRAVLNADTVAALAASIP